MNPVMLGVLLDRRIQEGWVLESLKLALAVPGVRLAAVAVAHGIVRKSLASRLHSIVDLLDERLRCRREPLFVPTDVPAEFEVPLLNVEVALHSDAGVRTRRGSSPCGSVRSMYGCVFPLFRRAGRCPPFPAWAYGASRSDWAYRQPAFGAAPRNWAPAARLRWSASLITPRRGTARCIGPSARP